MAEKRPKTLPDKLQAWVVARKRHRLSHAHVQMARELGMNPKKLGGLDNHRQQPWKAPLPQFIEGLFSKRDLFAGVSTSSAVSEVTVRARSTATTWRPPPPAGRPSPRPPGRSRRR